MNKNTYKESLEEIEKIIHIIENEDPDVDELSKLVKKASKLIGECKTKLKTTEDDLNNALEDI